MAARLRFLGAILLYLILWLAVERLFRIEYFIVPPALSVLSSLVGDLPNLWNHSAVTLQEALIGLAVGTGMGMALALLFLFWPLSEELIYPGAVVLRSLPFVAIAPILILALGGGIWPKVTVVVIASFFAIMVNFLRGLRTIDKELLALFRVMNASKWQTFAQLRLPYSLPFFFKGFEVSASSAVVVAIVGEVLASDRGLGYLILVSKYDFKMEDLYADMIVAAVLSLAFVAGAKLLERLVIRWEETTPW
ncbi:MAG: ABC transporter permease [Chloroflexi bacterium]|nr:ABC transporter permease [Chloroflexota bacterium]